MLERNANLQARAIQIGGSSATYVSEQECVEVIEGGEHDDFKRAWDVWEHQAEDSIKVREYREKGHHVERKGSSSTESHVSSALKTTRSLASARTLI